MPDWVLLVPLGIILLLATIVGGAAAVGLARELWKGP